MYVWHHEDLLQWIINVVTVRLYEWRIFPEMVHLKLHSFFFQDVRIYLILCLPLFEEDVFDFIFGVIVASTTKIRCGIAPVFGRVV